jgi:hypothetical protein
MRWQERGIPMASCLELAMNIFLESTLRILIRRRNRPADLRYTTRQLIHRSIDRLRAEGAVNATGPRRKD